MENIVTGEIPEPDQVVTAAPDTEFTEPEVTEVAENDKPVEDDKPVVKSFTQDEVDAIVGKRLARELRKLEREQAAKAIEAQPVATSANLKLTDFATPEDYAHALAEEKAKEIVNQREHRKQHSAIQQSYIEREEVARDKYDDYDQVALNDNLPITPVMAEVIFRSNIGPDMLYFLGSEGIKEAKRISLLPPVEQPYELGKLEAKLASTPTVKKTTSAPAPIVPVSARASSNPSYDTTDPRSIKSMTTSEWIEAERKRQIKKAEARKF